MLFLLFSFIKIQVKSTLIKIFFIIKGINSNINNHTYLSNIFYYIVNVASYVGAYVSYMRE